MRILDVYIIKELIKPFLFGVFAFSSVFIGGGTLWRIAQYVSKYGASFWIAAKLFLYSLPAVVVLTVPMAMLLASLLCFGRLSGQSEITAIKASGQSFFRLALPVFITAFFIASGAVVFNETVVPASTAAYNYLIRSEIERNTQPKTQEHVVMVDTEGSGVRFTYARKFDQNTSSMQNVTIQEYDKDRLVRVQHAERAVWQDNRWVMYAGVINDLSDESERTLYFQQQNMPVTKAPGEIALEQKKPEEMTIKELKQRIKMLEQVDDKASGLVRNSLAVELYQRLSIPLATFVFALIGSPLGLSPHRSSASIGFSLSILIIFVYYALMTAMTTMGQSGKIPALAAAWIPNIAALIAGIWLVYREG